MVWQRFGFVYVCMVWWRTVDDEDGALVDGKERGWGGILIIFAAFIS